METDVQAIGFEECEVEPAVESGQALIEYTLILVFVVIACFIALFAFQDVVINGIWKTASQISDVLAV